VRIDSGIGAEGQLRAGANRLLKVLALQAANLPLLVDDLRQISIRPYSARM